MHSIRVVPLPGNPRYYNSYLHKVRAVAGSSNHGIYSPPIPAAPGREAVPRRELSTNVIFDLDKRPDHIPEQQWNALSGFVYNALYLGCPDHMKHLFSRVPLDDGKAAVNSIRGSLGTVNQQKAKFSRCVLSNLEAFKEMSQYEPWFGELVEIHTHYNLIYQLPEIDQWPPSKLREDFTDGIGKFFPDIATSASSQPNLSIDDLHHLVLERLERLGISGLAATNSAGSFPSDGADDAPAVANFGYDENWAHWNGQHGSSRPQWDNYCGPSSGYQHDDYDGNHGEYNSYNYFTPDGDHSFWDGNWHPRKHAPFHPGSGATGAGVKKGFGKDSGKGKSKGKGKGFGAGKGKGKGGRGFARYTVSVLMTDIYTGEDFVNPRGEADSYGNLLVPSTDAQTAQFSLFGAATPSTTTNTPQTDAVKSTDPADAVPPAGQWWTLK